MKLSNILLNEYGEFKAEENKLEKLLKRRLCQAYRLNINMNAYDQDRKDDDPLKGKGFGSITFVYRDEIPHDDFEMAKALLTNQGLEVIEDQSTNYYDSDPGERDYFPKIKFHFNLHQTNYK